MLGGRCLVEMLGRAMLGWNVRLGDVCEILGWAMIVRDVR